MEGIVHHPQVGMIDLADEGRRLGGTGRQVTLEAVEIFEDQHHPRLLGVVGDGEQCLPGPSQFLRGRTSPAELADGRVNRPDELFDSPGLAGVHHPHQVVAGRHPDGGGRIDGVRLFRTDRDGRTLQPQAIEMGPHPAMQRRVEIEDRNLDGVVAPAANVIEQREMRFVDLGGPQQQVEAINHGGEAPSAGGASRSSDSGGNPANRRGTSASTRGQALSSTAWT